MCLNPSFIKNRKYIPNKKNGGVIPPVSDNRVLYVPVGCGVCIECKKQKSRSWQIRLKEDITHIKDDLDSIKEKISDHEKRIYRLEKVV